MGRDTITMKEAEHGVDLTLCRLGGLAMQFGDREVGETIRDKSTFRILCTIQMLVMVMLIGVEVLEGTMRGMKGTANREAEVGDMSMDTGKHDQGVEAEVENVAWRLLSSDGM